MATVLLALAGSVARPTVPAEAAPFKPSLAIEETGIAEGEHVFYDVGHANDAVRKMSDIGVNSLRLILEWNGSAHPDQLQLDATCNAAHAMVSEGMKILIVNLLPRARDFPKDDAGRGSFVSSYDDLYRLLLGPGGCAGRKLLIKVMPVNEINLTTFCDAQTDAGNLRRRACAEWAVILQHVVYADAQAAEAQYGVPISVIGLVVGSHHNPLNEIVAYCTSWRTHGYGEPDMDEQGFHPYALAQIYLADGTLDPYSGVRMTPRIQSVVAECFHRPIPIVYTEVGFKTAVPPDAGYNGTAQQGVLYVSLDQFVALQQHLAMLATSYGVIGIYNFLLTDEQSLSSGWQSGLYYFNGRPKPILNDYSRLVKLESHPPDDGTP
ncbi:MAG: hypothetical protein ACJ77E_18245 [Gaiellaceae bacterium]